MIKHSLASIEEAKKVLEFNPLVSFKEGLERTVEFLRINTDYQRTSVERIILHR